MKKGTIWAMMILVLGLTIYCASDLSRTKEKPLVKEQSYTVAEAKRVATLLPSGTYSENECNVTGYVVDRPTAKNSSGKFSFNIVDNLENKDNKLTIYLTASDSDIYQYDRVSVKAYLHNFNEGIVRLTEKKLDDGTYTNSNFTSIITRNYKTATAATTVTMRTIANFLAEKKEHYPLSDEFMERYQQTSGGYIDFAKKNGHPVDKQKHEPNQKWHFFDSWLNQSIEDGTLTWEDDAKSRVYTKLLCPELLLWIYEASDVDPVKVKNAKEVAEKGKIEGQSVSTIAKNMRSCVAWEDLKIV